MEAIPDQLAEDARGIRGLVISSGRPALHAQRKAAELYSPSQVTRECGAPLMCRRCPRLPASSTVDITADEQGQARNFPLASDRRRCRDRLRAALPRLVAGSPPRMWRSPLMVPNRPNMNTGAATQRDVDAEAPPHFVCDVFMCPSRGQQAVLARAHGGSPVLGSCVCGRRR